MPDEAIIMGVDAALALTGVGVIKVENDKFSIIHTELIKTGAELKLPMRLEQIYNAVSAAIEKYTPDILALEDMFYSKNLKIAFSLGQARGVVMLACARYQVCLAEYSAREIKQAVTGNGAASKEQVAFMIRKLLNLNGEFESFDISDSLAAAVCAGFRLKVPVLK